MFRSLRIKLTLINMSIIASLFLLLTTGSYLLAKNYLIRGSDVFLQDMLQAILQGKIEDLPPKILPPANAQNRGIPKEPPIFQDIGPSGNPDSHNILSIYAPPKRRAPVNDFFVRTNVSGSIILASTSTPLKNAKLSVLVSKALITSQAQKGMLELDQKNYLYYKHMSGHGQSALILFHDFTQEQEILQTLLLALLFTGIICLIFSFFGSLYMANRAIIPIQKAWEQQKVFLADASHEFRTPISIIQTNLEVVLEDEQQTIKSQMKWLKNIKDEIGWMTSFVDSLLFLARSDSQQQLLESRQFSLDQTIAAAVEAFKPIAASRQIGLDMEINDTILFYGDESKIKQLVGILLDNAVKYTKSGGNILIELIKNGNNAVLDLSDTGIGIKSDHIDKIFNRFYQIEQSRTNKGAGLGLSIAKWIVEKHKGSIHVSSTPGLGTTFRICLPLNMS